MGTVKTSRRFVDSSKCDHMPSVTQCDHWPVTVLQVLPVCGHTSAVIAMGPGAGRAWGGDQGRGGRGAGGNSKFIVGFNCWSAAAREAEAGIDKTRGHGTSVLGLLAPGYTQHPALHQPATNLRFLVFSRIVCHLFPVSTPLSPTGFSWISVWFWVRQVFLSAVTRSAARLGRGRERGETVIFYKWDPNRSILSIKPSAVFPNTDLSLYSANNL